MAKLISQSSEPQPLMTLIPYKSGSHVSKEDDCRDGALQTMQLAQRASSSADKGRLLRLAGAWLDLADRVRRIGRPKILQSSLQDKHVDK
jgi:hypothetical protein